MAAVLADLIVSISPTSDSEANGGVGLIAAAQKSDVIRSFLSQSEEPTKFTSSTSYFSPYFEKYI